MGVWAIKQTVLTKNFMFFEQEFLQVYNYVFYENCLPVTSILNISVFFCFYSFFLLGNLDNLKGKILIKLFSLYIYRETLPPPLVYLPEKELLQPPSIRIRIYI
jgi:hypothetical protein